jgi:hypothetical protein
MELRFVPTTDEHAQFIASNCRQADREEFAAGSGEDPLTVIRYGMRVSVVLFTALVDGEPVCIFGASPASMAYGIGCPWMVATPRMERYAKTVVRVSGPILEEMHKVFPHLVNFVDNRNEKAHRWLEWMGFQFYPPRPHGVAGLPFMMFERKVQHV